MTLIRRSAAVRITIVFLSYFSIIFRKKGNLYKPFPMELSSFYFKTGKAKPLGLARRKQLVLYSIANPWSFLAHLKEMK